MTLEQNQPHIEQSALLHRKALVAEVKEDARSRACNVPDISRRPVPSRDCPVRPVASRITDFGGPPDHFLHPGPRYNARMLDLLRSN